MSRISSILIIRTNLLNKLKGVMLTIKKPQITNSLPPIEVKRRQMIKRLPPIEVKRRQIMKRLPPIEVKRREVTKRLPAIEVKRREILRRKKLLAQLNQVEELMFSFTSVTQIHKLIILRDNLEEQLYGN